MWKEAAVVSLAKLRKRIKIPEIYPRISQIPLGDKFRFPNSTRRTPKHLCQSNCKSHQSRFATFDKIKYHLHCSATTTRYTTVPRPHWRSRLDATWTRKYCHEVLEITNDVRDLRFSQRSSAESSLVGSTSKQFLPDPDYEDTTLLWNARELFTSRPEVTPWKTSIFRQWRHIPVTASQTYLVTVVTTAELRNKLYHLYDVKLLGATP
jgi:hypothetical protein